MCSKAFQVTWLVLFVMFMLFVGVSTGTGRTGQDPLTVYCGAGLMKPMDELKAGFEQRYKVPLQVVYGGSGELFGIIAARKDGGVFVPGSAKYIKDAAERGMVLAEGQKTLCYHVPVILVPAGNPAHIRSLRDLARPGVRVALADAKAAAIGKVANVLLTKIGLLDQVNKNVVVRPNTTNQLLLYTVTDQVDACLAWEDQATWEQANGKIEIIHIPPEQNAIKTIPAAVLTHTQQLERAQTFVDYISSPEAKALWKKWGFPIEKPQKSAEMPPSSQHVSERKAVGY